MIGGNLVFSLYPLANVSAMSHSIYTNEPSLLMRTVACAEEDMQDHGHLEFIKFMHIIKAFPIGVKFTLIGILTTEGLMNMVKAFATALPIAITLSLTTIHKKT